MFVKFTTIGGYERLVNVNAIRSIILISEQDKARVWFLGTDDDCADITKAQYEILLERLHSFDNIIRIDP